ncbi:hypothetical protein RHO13_08080 [Orbus wheelerorum]|uniref:hypothetical protein n=1 Tax=Orbus wheelerorum TaxID=3074111 RepID=UPI00370D974A
MKKIKLLHQALIVLISFWLIGCNDNIDQYKDRIQYDNDRRNPTGNRSLCLAVGDLAKTDYPYTIKYIEGEINEDDTWDPIAWNNILNQRLANFAKAGLFSEQQVGEDNGKPLYRYQFTPEGEKYAHWWGGSVTYFCFGRVVVDKITRVSDLGGSTKIISFYFHYENLPDWVKHDYIYKMYYPNISGENDVTGQQIIGSHQYSFDHNGNIDKMITSMSGFYTL